MHANYHRRKLRGLPRYPTHCPTGLHVKLHGRGDAFQRGISGLAP